MKFFLTTPIYYVNAKPHIGHIYTTVAADVLARYYRRKYGSENVLFSTGTDENSQKNVEAAAAAGQDIKTYVDEMAAIWEHTFAQLGFTHNIFIRTTAPAHERAVKQLLSVIAQHGDVYLGDYEGFYCVSCEEFKAPNDLADGRCPVHGTVPQRLKEKNYFFRLKKYQPDLRRYYAEHPDFVQPAAARHQMLDYIEHELADVSISRQAQAWGIRLPQDESHAVYVWFDALINYLTVTGYPGQGEAWLATRLVPRSLGGGGSSAQRSGGWWPPDLHLIGKDITKFHCAIWPAMLMSARLPLPKIIYAHGFFTINGQKISKSLGNAIDPLQLVKEYPFDAIRYYLLRDIPFGSDGDFSHDRLRDRYNADLANGLGNLVSRVLNMIEKFWPDFSDQGVLPSDIEREITTAAEALDALRFDESLKAIWRVIAWLDGTIEATKPWELARHRNNHDLKRILSEAYAILDAVNKALAPFMPDTHQKLTSLLDARPLKKPATPLFARK